MSGEAIVVVVPSHGRGARLDRFLVAALASHDDPPSREEVKRWIERGLVTVAGRAGKAADKLREGETVRVVRAPRPRTEAAPEEGIVFDVLFVDEAVVVVNKPAGLVVHPARGHAGGTLVNGLLARGLFDRGKGKLEGAERAGAPCIGTEDPGDREGHLRPGIVHRLDKGTSGILVVARTQNAREKLKAQFAAHAIVREYEALCVGEVIRARHETFHGRHPTDRLRFTSRLDHGKRAVTHIHVVERFGKLATHVVCRLETGRTHQIRVHLSETGTPILGDPLYGKPPKDPRVRAIAAELGHQALHARLLGFVHPVSGERLRFEASPPPDFARALAALRALD